MPFRSQRQAKYMFAAEARGDVEPGTAERWAKETPDMKKLPESVHKARAAAYKRLRRTGGAESP